MLWLFGAAAVVVLLFFVFKDTVNRLQYIQLFRVYWITKDNGSAGTPVVLRSFMRQTSPPWWRGTGVQFRIGKYTFQVGLLREKATPQVVTDMEDEAGGLLAQLGGRELDLDAKTIRKEWV